MIPWNEIFTRDSRFFDRGRKQEDERKFVELFWKKRKRGEKNLVS